jgi:hypothetical protein
MYKSISVLLSAADFLVMLRRRDDGTNGNNGKDGKIKENFRLFRYFRLFRHLFFFPISSTRK